MGEVIDLTNFKETVRCSCINCKFTNPQQTLGFYVCQCESSTVANELVDNNYICDCYKRRDS